jgi:serine/threonine-protein kinase
MLTGAPPHEGDTPLAVAMQHLNQSPEPLENRRPDIPDTLAKVIHRMLAKKPADRFADPAALLRELHGLAKQGAEQGWATAPQDWSLAEMIAVADDRAAATARLDEVMKTTALVRPRRLRGRWIVAGVAVCVLLGVAAGVLTRPRPLLAGATSGPPRLGSEWAQLYQAKIVDTEAAWQAVEVHFPQALPYYHNLAKQGLANYYLFRSQEYEKARGPLRDLAKLGASNPALEAFGIAGLVVAEAKLGNTDAARNENSNLTPDMRTLLQQRSPQLFELLEATLRELNRP